MAAFEMKERRPPPDDNVRKVNFMYLVKLSKSDITYSPSAGFSMSKCYFVSDSFDTVGKNLDYVRTLKLFLSNGNLIYSRVRNRRRAGNKRRVWKICQKE